MEERSLARSSGWVALALLGAALAAPRFAATGPLSGPVSLLSSIALTLALVAALAAVGAAVVETRRGDPLQWKGLLAAAPVLLVFAAAAVSGPAAAGATGTFFVRLAVGGAVVVGLVAGGFAIVLGIARGMIEPQTRNVVVGGFAVIVVMVAATVCAIWYFQDNPLDIELPYS
jgi:hypothetical protein